MTTAEDFTKLIEPRNHIDRDLMTLAGKRVGEAVTSVLQLAEDQEQAMRIILGAFTTSAAHLGATYHVLRDGAQATEPSEVERLNIGIEAMKVLRDAAMRIGR